MYLRGYVKSSEPEENDAKRPRVPKGINASDLLKRKVGQPRWVVDQLIKLKKKQCYGPVGGALPRFDVSKPNVSEDSFVQVTPTLYVFADAPRFCAFGLSASGFQVGDEATDPPEKGRLFPGDELFIEREFITYFTGECEPTTSHGELLFYVRWCCAHKVTAADTLDGWKGKNVKCKPNPTPVPTIPAPLKPKDAKDFIDALSALSAANASDAYSLQLGEEGTVTPLPKCRKK